MEKQLKQIETKELFDGLSNVFHQKLGDTWYAFCEINEEVYYAKIPEEVIPILRKKKKRRAQSNTPSGPNSLDLGAMS